MVGSPPFMVGSPPVIVGIQLTAGMLFVVGAPRFIVGALPFLVGAFFVGVFVGALPFFFGFFFVGAFIGDPVFIDDAGMSDGMYSVGFSLVAVIFDFSSAKDSRFWSLKERNVELVRCATSLQNVGNSDQSI